MWCFEFLKHIYSTWYVYISKYWLFPLNHWGLFCNLWYEDKHLRKLMLRTAWRCLPAICSTLVWSPCTPQPATSLQFPIIIPGVWMAAKQCLFSIQSSINRHTCCQHSGKFPLHFFTTKIFFFFFKLVSHSEKLTCLWYLGRVKIWHSSPAENQSSWWEEYSH